MADEIPLDVISRLRGDSDVASKLEKLARRLDKLDKEQEDAKDSADKLDESHKRQGQTVTGLLSKYKGLSALLGGFSAIQIGRWALDTAMSFEMLEVQLEAVVEDGEDVTAVFDQLKQFAASTPFQLQNVAEAYIGLRARGFEPTMEVMTALGDLAGTFGKDFGTAMQAVTQAAFGEAEMLKQFGIVMKQEQDKVRVLFRGTEEVIEKDSQAIFDHLIRLSEVEFAGGAENLAQTLTGRVSTLKDNLAELADVVFRQSGVTDALSALTSGLTDLIQLDWKGLLQSWEDLVIGVNLGINEETVAQLAELSAKVQGLNEPFGPPDIVDPEARENVDRIIAGLEAIEALQQEIRRLELLAEQEAIKDAIADQKKALTDAKKALEDHKALQEEIRDIQAEQLALTEETVAAREAGQLGDQILASGPGAFEIDFVPSDESLDAIESEWRTVAHIVADDWFESTSAHIDELGRQWREEINPSGGRVFGESFGENMEGIGRRLGDAAVLAIVTSDLDDCFSNLGAILAADVSGALLDSGIDALVSGGLSRGAATGVVAFGAVMAAGFAGALDRVFGSSNAVTSGFQASAELYGDSTSIFRHSVTTFDEAAEILAEAARTIRGGLNDFFATIGGGSLVPGAGSMIPPGGFGFGEGVPGTGGGGRPDAGGGNDDDAIAFREMLTIQLEGVLNGVFDDLSIAVTELGGEWSVGIAGVVSGWGETVEEATQDAMDRFARQIPAMIETGMLDLEGVPPEIVAVLERGVAQTWDELVEILDTATEIFTGSLGPIESEIFTFFGDLRAVITEGVRIGLPLDTVRGFVANELDALIAGFADIDLQPAVDAGPILEEFRADLIALGFSATEADERVAQLASSLEIFNMQAEANLLCQMVSLLEQIPGQEEEVRRIRAELAQLEFQIAVEQLRLQAELLDLTKREAKRIAEVLDIAADFGEDIGNFLADLPRIASPTITVPEEAKIEFPQTQDVRVVDDLTQDDIAADRSAVLQQLQAQRSSLEGQLIGGFTGELTATLFAQEERREDLIRRGIQITSNIKDALDDIDQLEVDLIFRDITDAIAGLSRVGAARQSIEDLLGSIDDMREALGILEDEGEDVTDAMEDLAEQEAQLRKELETDVLARLFAFFEGTGRHEEEILELKKAQQIIELEILRAELEALGIFEQYADVWQEAVDLVNEGVVETTANLDDLRNAVEALRDSQLDVLTGPDSPLTGEQQFFVQLGQFNDLLSAVQGGDLSLVSELIGARSDLLGLAGGLGSGVLAQIFASTFSQFDDLIESLDEQLLEDEEPLTKGSYAEGATQTQEAIRDSGTAVVEAINQGALDQQEKLTDLESATMENGAAIETVANRLGEAVEALEEIVRLQKAS